MQGNSGHGEWLKRRFPGAISGVLTTSSLGEAPPVAVSFLKTDTLIQLGDITPENAFSLHVNRSMGARLNIRRPKSLETHWMGLHGCAIYDLSDLPMISMASRFDTIRVYMPAASLEEIAQDRMGQPAIRLVSPGIGFKDDILAHLALTIESVSQLPESPPQLLVDHLALSLQVHLLHRYTEQIPSNPAIHGGLAGWQLKRAQDLMLSRLGEDMSLAELAGSCNLSSRHFTRAFRESTGFAPFQWLAAKRLETAREMVVHTDVPVHEIARRCGYSDHSHLSRTFRQKFGTSPGEERRKNGSFSAEHVARLMERNSQH